MKTEFVFITPGLSTSDVVEDYEEVMLKHVPHATIKWITHAPGSAASAQKFFTDGFDTDKDTQYILLSFSAGYGWVREASKAYHSIVKQAIGYLAIDSIHDSAKMGRIGDWAPLASGIGSDMVVGHTNIPTTYASTTEMAFELQKRHGITREHWDSRLGLKAQHVRALTECGAQALKRLLVRLDIQAPKLEEPWHNKGLCLGLRCLAWSDRQVQLGVKEHPKGSNRGPEISKYFKDAQRKGQSMAFLSKTGGPWCAAAACYAESAVLHPGEERFTPHVVSGIELENWAMKNGHWAETLLDCEAGDLVILRRGGGWKRHVARINHFYIRAGAFQTVGGNEGDEWRFANRTAGDDNIIGYIRYPQRDKVAEVDKTIEREKALTQIKSKWGHMVEDFGEIVKAIDLL